MSRKVVQKALNGSEIQVWESPSQAEKETGVYATHIIKCCKGYRNSAGGFKWEYAEAHESPKVSAHSNQIFWEQEVNNDKGTLKSTKVINYEPKDDIELAKEHKVDLTKYKITTYWTKKLPNGNFTSSLLCSLKKSDDMSKEDLINFLSSYKSDYKPFGELIINQSGNKCLALIDITDFHLDKKSLDGKSPKDRITEYFTVLLNLTRRSYSAYNIDRICFIINSDMLHVDNFWGQTTKGTPQETSMRWHEAFSTAFDLYAKSIQHLKQFCNKLDVISILGNHARVSEFHLAFGLMKYFESDNDITFDVSPDPRKVYTYGSTFIGLHHGNTKIMDLPLVFSKEFGKEWGNAKFHEIKVGDQHHYMEKDYKGVLIKQLPALCGTDTWHNDNNYVNSVKGAICTIYDYDKGRIADLHERI